MKSIKTFVAVIALATSFGSFAAQTVTATASTIDGAEAKIAAQAQEAGASSYKITILLKALIAVLFLRNISNRLLL